ncbi:MAG: sporulation protein YqfD, partial [Lachnospiraceae bacterium]|nr:sporulation protein YqfD [Lachnospiraceae bacterium]
QLFFRPRSGMYSYVSEHRQLKILDDFYLPLYYEKKSYSEYILKDMQYTDKEAGRLLNKNLMSFCEDLEEKGVQILEKNVKISKGSKQYRAQGSLTVLKKADLMGAVQLAAETTSEE